LKTDRLNTNQKAGGSSPLWRAPFTPYENPRRLEPDVSRKNPFTVNFTMIVLKIPLGILGEERSTILGIEPVHD
jgi:hypothetical protein